MYFTHAPSPRALPKKTKKTTPFSVNVYHNDHSKDANSYEYITFRQIIIIILTIIIIIQIKKIMNVENSMPELSFCGIKAYKPKNGYLSANKVIQCTDSDCWNYYRRIIKFYSMKCFLFSWSYIEGKMVQGYENW